MDFLRRIAEKRMIANFKFSVVLITAFFGWANCLEIVDQPLQKGNKLCTTINASHQLFLQLYLIGKPSIKIYDLIKWLSLDQ